MFTTEWYNPRPGCIRRSTSQTLCCSGLREERKETSSNKGAASSKGNAADESGSARALGSSVFAEVNFERHFTFTWADAHETLM